MSTSERGRRKSSGEVREIRVGTVVIKSVARAPGEGAKIAVTSTKADVDPINACLGPKASRLNAIVREVRGERIDIVEWSDDLAVFAARALMPAEVSQVRVIDAEL